MISSAHDGSFTSSFPIWILLFLFFLFSCSVMSHSFVTPWTVASDSCVLGVSQNRMSSLASESVNRSIVSDSLPPHELQPTRLLCPWNTPGKNTGVGDHFLLQKGFSSLQFTRSVVSDTLRPHRTHHARPPCPLPAPEFYSNSCPLSFWCHPTISSSIVPFSSCLQSFPASGSFPSQFFASSGQSIGVSTLASLLPINTQD